MPAQCATRLVQWYVCDSMVVNLQGRETYRGGAVGVAVDCGVVAIDHVVGDVFLVDSLQRLVQLRWKRGQNVGLWAPEGGTTALPERTHPMPHRCFGQTTTHARQVSTGCPHRRSKQLVNASLSVSCCGVLPCASG